MKLGTLFLINAVVAAAFAIPLVLAPGELLPVYGVETTPGALLLARFFGAALSGYAAVSWQSRALEEGSPGARAVVTGFVVPNAIGTVVALAGRFQGVGNAMGWSSVVIYLFFTASYGAMARRKPA
jgi:hypothetical protein